MLFCECYITGLTTQFDTLFLDIMWMLIIVRLNAVLY